MRGHSGGRVVTVAGQSSFAVRFCRRCTEGKLFAGVARLEAAC